MQTLSRRQVQTFPWRQVQTLSRKCKHLLSGSLAETSGSLVQALGETVGNRCQCLCIGALYFGVNTRWLQVLANSLGLYVSKISGVSEIPASWFVGGLHQVEVMGASFLWNRAPGAFHWPAWVSTCTNLAAITTAVLFSNLGVEDHLPGCNHHSWLNILFYHHWSVWLQGSHIDAASCILI